MNIDIDISDAKSLVKGTSPYYSEFENPIIVARGKFLGGFHDIWIWDDNSLDRCNIGQLVDIYHICKRSWENSL